MLALATTVGHCCATPFRWHNRHFDVVHVFSVVLLRTLLLRTHGMNAAGFSSGFLAVSARESKTANLQYTNLFELVNEGAITVEPFSTSLTAIGR